MATATRTYSKTYDVNTNGLGEVIRVPWGEATPQDSNCTYTRNERFLVLLKPNPGVKIDGGTSWFHVYKNSNNSNSPTNEDYYKDAPIEQSMSIQTCRPDESQYTHNYSWNFNGTYLCGTIFLGYEDFYVYSYDAYAAGWEIQEETHYVEIQGEKDYLTLNIIGEEECQQCLYYTFKNKPYVVRTHNGTSHTYSNIVAFEQPYMSASDYNAPVNAYQCNSYVDERRVAWLGDNTRPYLEFGSMTSDTGISVENWSIPMSVSIREILMYIDSFLVVYSPTVPGENMSDYDGNMTSKVLTTKPQISSRKCWQTFQDNSIRVNIPSQLGIFATKKDYEMHKDDNREELPDDARVQYMVMDETTTIQFEDRWVRCCCLRSNGSDVKISGFYNIVETVSSGNQIWMNCESKYSRFTDNWYFVEDYTVRDNAGWVVPDNGTIPAGTGANKLCVPIMKPFAAVELVVFDHGSAGNFGRNGMPSSNGLYNVTHEKLKKQCKMKYRKTIHIQADAETDDEWKKFKRYCRTVSPFRIEHFICHGARMEYDKESTQNGYDGRSGICATKPDANAEGYKVLQKQDIDKMHNACKHYNGLFNDIKWCIFDQCCFGQGVAYSNSRSPYTHICRYADDMVNASDAMTLFCACGTHPGFGENGTCKDYSEYPFDFVVGRHTTYANIASEYNAIIQKCRKVTYKKIKEFYINNYDLMLSLLDGDEYKQMWNDTKSYIIDELDQEGNTYFCRGYQDDPSDWNWRASDNYINYDRLGKKYRIYDGFMGYIKKNINSDLIDDLVRPGWPSKLPTFKKIAETCQKFFGDLGLNMWYFFKHPVDNLTHGKYDVEENNTRSLNELYISSIDDFSDENLNEELNSTQKSELSSKIEAAKSAWNSLLANTTTLVKEIKKMYVEASGNTYDETKDSNPGDVSTATAFTLPVCRVMGQFAEPNKQFMRNPDDSQHMWLSSDDDLNRLSQLNSLASIT